MFSVLLKVDLKKRATCIEIGLILLFRTDTVPGSLVRRAAGRLLTGKPRWQCVFSAGEAQSKHMEIFARGSRGPIFKLGELFDYFPAYLMVAVNTSSMTRFVRQPDAGFNWLRLSVQIGWETPLKETRPS